MKAQIRTHRGRRHPGRFGKVASPRKRDYSGKLTWRAFQDRHKFIRSHALPMG